jgi:microcystin-dependent protein
MKKHFLPYFLFVLYSVCSYNLYAQVGINQDDPDSCSILDINHNKKGLLIPRVESKDVVDGGNQKPESLLIFDQTDHLFYYWDSMDWQAINSWYARDTNNIISRGNVTISNNLTTTGNITVSKPSVINGYGTIPVGGIIMWSGIADTSFDADGNGIGNLEGWALCDGTNDRPDLKGRFVVGYDKNQESGPVNATNKETNYGTIRNTGGEDAHTLSPSETAIRTHTHNVSGTTSDMNHQHVLWGTCKYTDATAKNVFGGAGSIIATDDGNASMEHAGTSGWISTDDMLIGSVSGTAENIPEYHAQYSHENRPAYFVVAFIIRLR